MHSLAIGEIKSFLIPISIRMSYAILLQSSNSFISIKWFTNARVISMVDPQQLIWRLEIKLEDKETNLNIYCVANQSAKGKLHPGILLCCMIG